MGHGTCILPNQRLVLSRGHVSELWALYGDLGGHHLGGDLINPLFIHIYFILHSYNTVIVLDSNRLEKLPPITIDVGPTLPMH